jgi:hypothetical protein
MYQAVAYSLALQAPTILILPESSDPIFGCYEVLQIPNAKVFVLSIKTPQH